MPKFKPKYQAIARTMVVPFQHHITDWSPVDYHLSPKQNSMGGLDLAIFRVLRVRQNSHITSKTGHFGVLRNKSSDANISTHASSAPPSCFGTGHVTFCLHHLGIRSTPAYASTDVPAHLISVLPVRSGRSKGNS